MNNAPIALFVYKRPEHTLKTLESLMSNAEFSDSSIFVFCDGPKNEDDIPEVKATRELIHSFSLPNAKVVERQKNFGLADSIITGVTELCRAYSKVIVLEDDLVVSPHFLDYMNNALNLYENEERVMQISGYMFPVELKIETDAIFLPYTTSWGWATWERAWKIFDPEMSGYSSLKENKLLRYKFNLDESYDYFDMLESKINDKIDTWAIQWYLSVFMLGGLTLHPIRTLVKNIGFDGSGQHCGKSDKNDYIDTNFTISNFPPVYISNVTSQIYSHLADSKNIMYSIRRKIKKLLEI